jgi:hypothetical protein
LFSNIPTPDSYIFSNGLHHRSVNTIFKITHIVPPVNFTSLSINYSSLLPAQASVDKVVVQVGAVLQVAEGRANVAADMEYTAIPVRPFEEAV